MGRYRIQLPNVRQYARAYRDTACAGCDEPISQGDPIAQIDHMDGYYCTTCVLLYGKKGTLREI